MAETTDHVATLQTMFPHIPEPALRRALEVSGTPDLAATLLDQLVCARASHLVLNAFSTFSQLVMGRIGLEHAQTVGWARDLNEAQQRAVGVTVLFHRRTRRDGVTLSNGRDK